MQPRRRVRPAIPAVPISGPAETPSDDINSSPRALHRGHFECVAGHFFRAWDGQQEFFGLTAPAPAPNARPRLRSRGARPPPKRRISLIFLETSPAKGGGWGPLSRLRALLLSQTAAGGANLERRVGSRWQRIDGGDRPRLDVDRGHRTGPDGGRTRLKVGADRRTGLDRLRLNVRGRCRRCAGRNRDGLWPDIGLARRHVGPMGLYVDRRRTSVGEAQVDQRVIWCWPLGVDIGECGPGQGFQ